MEYRLDKYRIIGSENGMLWWETHFPVAMQRRGKCFVFGDTLIIGQPRHEEDGYLILEFHDQLKKLPVWNKTSYYCYASNLLDVVTGEKLSEDFLQQKMSLSAINKEGQKSVIGLKSGKYRLGSYQIIVTDNGEVEWRTHGRINNIISGRCIIESDMLFINPEEHDKSEQNKEKFISELHQLPQWSYTVAWCKSMVLQPCQPQHQTGRPRAAILMNSNTYNRSLSGQSSAIYLRKHAEVVKELFQSCVNWLRTSWQRIQPARFRLKYLLLLVVAGLLLGLLILLYSVGERLHWTNSGKEHHEKPSHHYKNDDEKD